MIQPMEVHLLLTDGTRSSFKVEDKKTIFEFFDRPKPPDFFGSTYFAVEGSHRIAVFPGHQIATLDLETTEPVAWKMHMGIEAGQIEEASAEELRKALRPENWKQFDRDAGGVKRGDFEGYVRFRLSHGNARVARVRTTTPPSMQQRMLLETLLKRSMFFFPRVGGGLCFINPAAVSRLDLLPGLPEIAPGALKGTETTKKPKPAPKT